MNLKELLSLTAERIADEVYKKGSNAKKLIIRCISEGEYTQDEFGLLVKVNEILLQRRVEKEKDVNRLILQKDQNNSYPEFSLSLIYSNQMWSEQEDILTDILLEADMLGPNRNEFYRKRLRALLFSFMQKNLTISVEEAKDPEIQLENQNRDKVERKITLAGISTNRIPKM